MGSKDGAMSVSRQQGIPGQALAEAVDLLRNLVHTMTTELGSSPTLAEVLEVIGWSVPSQGPSTISVQLPLKFNAKIGTRNYRADIPSRVDELNDESFVLAAELLGMVLVSIESSSGSEPSIETAAVAPLSVLRQADITTADVPVRNITALKASEPKRIRRSKNGDIVAVPLSGGGYRTAIVLDHTSTGVALGVFKDAVPSPNVNASKVKPTRPIFTDDQELQSVGSILVGHDENMIGRFGVPEVYHAPGRQLVVDVGPFGAAEAPDGSLRLLGEDEARAIGLLDVSYQDLYICGSLRPYLESIH
jgi:hypothetical protein